MPATTAHDDIGPTRSVRGALVPENSRLKHIRKRMPRCAWWSARRHQCRTRRPPERTTRSGRHDQGWSTGDSATSVVGESDEEVRALEVLGEVHFDGVQIGDVDRLDQHGVLLDGELDAALEVVLVIDASQLALQLGLVIT